MRNEVNLERLAQRWQPWAWPADHRAATAERSTPSPIASSASATEPLPAPY